MAAAGRGKARRRSDATREHRNRRRCELRLQRKRERGEDQRNGQQQDDKVPAATDSSSDPPPSPATLLPLLASAAASSLRFLAHHDLLLLPSQTLSLESALSRLHSRLLKPPFPAPPVGGSGHAGGDSEYWFLRFLASTASDGSDPRWVDAFRMSRPSFYLLLQTLAPSLSYPSSSPPPDHKLGAALFRLAHAAPFRAVGRRFGFEGGSAAACRAFYEVCRAVVDRLGHLFELPSDVKRVIQGFRWATSLPNCRGVLGFARFPAGGGVVAQVVVDSEGRFLDVSAGWPASMAPAQILPKSKLSSTQDQNLLINAGGHDENGVVFTGSRPSSKLSSAQAQNLPCNAGRYDKNGVGVNGSSPPGYFLGGSCCPLLPWLLTPFPESDISEDYPFKRVFNEVHAHGMKLAGKAVRALRARWRLLAARWSTECMEALPFVIVVSCLLHNFLFKCSEDIPEEVFEPAAAAEEFPEFEGKGDKAGESLRETLATHLYSVNQMG